MGTYIKAYLYCGLKTYLTVTFRQWVVTTNILKKAEKKRNKQRKGHWSYNQCAGWFSLLRKCGKIGFLIFFILFIQHRSCQWGILIEAEKLQVKRKLYFCRTWCGSQESTDSSIWKNVNSVLANVQSNKLFMASRKKLETWKGVKSWVFINSVP